MHLSDLFASLQRGEQLLYVTCVVANIYEAERITRYCSGAHFANTRQRKRTSISCCCISRTSKGDRFEFAIQKSVELGVAEIVPFESEHRCRCGGRRKKQARRRKSPQKGKSVRTVSIPTVRDPIMYSDVVGAQRVGGTAPSAMMGDGTQLPKLLGREHCPNVVAFAVGPEGGFSAREIDMAREAEIPLCAGQAHTSLRNCTALCARSASYEFELMRHDASDLSMDENEQNNGAAWRRRLRRQVCPAPEKDKEIAV